MQDGVQMEGVDSFEWDMVSLAMQYQSDRHGGTYRRIYDQLRPRYRPEQVRYTGNWDNNSNKGNKGNKGTREQWQPGQVRGALCLTGRVAMGSQSGKRRCRLLQRTIRRYHVLVP
jgi:hypothetical protein